MREKSAIAQYGEEAIAKAQMGMPKRGSHLYFGGFIWLVVTFVGSIIASPYSENGIPSVWMMCLVQIGAVTSSVCVAMFIKRQVAHQGKSDAQTIKDIRNAKHERKMNEFLQSQKEADPRDKS
jgi:mannitol-specific phosphotransferase system IIBC component